MRKELEAAEMWFSRKMQQIPLTQRKTSKQALSFRTTKTSSDDKKKRQLKFPRHVMRRQKLENFIMTGKFKGKEENLEKYCSGKWHEKRKAQEIIRNTKNYSRRRRAIDIANRHGT